MLNLLWCGLFLSGAIVALGRVLWLNDYEVFTRIMSGLFESSHVAFEIALALTGILALWLGIMRIAEKSGVLTLLTRFLQPLFQRLMPEIPENHPALGAVVMNLSANALGLDNAATPLGIKAMQELQTLNPTPEQATNAQILFLVLNTSAVTLFPISIFTYRAQMGAITPTDVFIPILIATYCSTFVGLLSVAWIQKIRLFTTTVMLYLLGFTALIFAVIGYFANLPADQMQYQSAIVSNFLLLGVISLFLIMAIRNRVNAYEAFIEGAKEGFQTAITIIPYLVAMLAAISVFRSCGAMELLMDCLRDLTKIIGIDGRFIDAIPTALMKPFSGSGSRALMVDTMQTFGADSFAGRLSAIIQGSTETTFYVLAVYFGAVGVKRIRHAAVCGLIADFAGIIAAIFITYWFFG